MSTSPDFNRHRIEREIADLWCRRAALEAGAPSVWGSPGYDLDLAPDVIRRIDLLIAEYQRALVTYFPG